MISSISLWVTRALDFFVTRYVIPPKVTLYLDLPIYAYHFCFISSDQQLLFSISRVYPTSLNLPLLL